MYNSVGRFAENRIEIKENRESRSWSYLPHSVLRDLTESLIYS